MKVGGSLALELAAGSDLDQRNAGYEPGQLQPPMHPSSKLACCVANSFLLEALYDSAEQLQ